MNRKKTVFGGNQSYFGNKYFENRKTNTVSGDLTFQITEFFDEDIYDSGVPRYSV